MKVRPKEPGDRKSRNRASASRSREKEKQRITEAELNVERLLDLKEQLTRSIAELSSAALSGGAAPFQPSRWGGSGSAEPGPNPGFEEIEEIENRPFAYRAPAAAPDGRHTGAGAEQCVAAALDELFAESERTMADGDGLPVLVDSWVTDVEADWDTAVSRFAQW